MPRIPARRVVIRRRYIVDCDVCQEGVEPESGAFEFRWEAESAKTRHLAQHALPPAEPDPPHQRYI